MATTLLDKKEIDFVIQILENEIEDCRIWAFEFSTKKKHGKAARLDNRIIKISEIVKKLKS